MREPASETPPAPPADAPLGSEIPTHSADGRELSPAARRALAEAAARRAAAQESAGNQGQAEAEKGGPKGPEPTRFGDWERKGIAVDF